MGKGPERAKMFVRYRERPNDLWCTTGMIRAFVFDLDGTLVETEELANHLESVFRDIPW